MVRKLLFSLLLIPTLAAPAGLNAQNRRINEGPPPKFELYGGYSRLMLPYDHTQANPFSGGANGWDASLRIPVPVVGRWLGIKGDVSGDYRNDGPNFNPHSYFFLAGPQLSAHFGRSTLFVHGLVGSAHLNQQVIPSLKSGSTFAMAAGGGFDFGIAHNFAWRITGDFYNTNFQSSDVTVKGIVNSNGRISTGPVLRF
jgi:opacity protein-like surface antigen